VSSQQANTGWQQISAGAGVARAQPQVDPKASAAGELGPETCSYS
jgi:hypothetical protein